MGRVLKELPRLKLVWAHGCGRLNPAKIHEILDRNPALYCDLPNMTNTGGYGSGWPRGGVVHFKNGGGRRVPGALQKSYPRIP